MVGITVKNSMNLAYEPKVDYQKCQSLNIGKKEKFNIFQIYTQIEF
jgi:hypothetical protein